MSCGELVLYCLVKQEIKTVFHPSITENIVL